MTSISGLWARIESGRVVELITIDPAGRFHADLQWQDVSDCPDVTQGWVWDGKTAAAPPVGAPDLATARSALAAYRLGREIAGVHFQPAGAAAAAVFATDRESQAKLSAACVLALNGHWVAGTPWKDASGAFVPLSSADIQALAVHAGLYVAACYAHEAALAAALSDNPAADITQGWPTNT